MQMHTRFEFARSKKARKAALEEILVAHRGKSAAAMKPHGGPPHAAAIY